MTTQISPQMRIVAIAGVLLIALAGAALLFLRHAKPGTVTVPSTPRLTTPAATTPATSAGHRPTARTRTTSTPTQPPKHSTRPRAAHHAAHHAAPKLAAVDPRLPVPLRVALARHPFVVVATFDPQVHEDSLALVEARRGAAAAGAPFVAVNLLDDRVAGPLTALLASGQLLPAPGLLVYRRPGRLVYRFDGYLDRAAVTQAVRDVKK